MNQMPDRSQFTFDDGLLSPPKLQPVRALRAFARLVEDKEDTSQVFEIIEALSGKSINKGYARMLTTQKGGEQAYARIELSQYFDDPDWLAKFPKGTIGAAYREFRDERDLTIFGLAQEAAKVNDRVEAPHPIAWYARRIRDVHDVWHTITGYKTDALGEASLLAFTFGQLGNGALAFIAAGAANEFRKSGHPHPYGKAILEGYRHGRAARRLIDEDYLALLGESVDKARERLAIATPSIYLSIPAEARNAYAEQQLAA